MLLRRSRPEAVLLSYQHWTDLRREIEDLKDNLALLESRETPPDLRVSHDKLRSELGLVAEDPP